MALASKQSVERASAARVSGARGVSGAGGLSLSIPLQKMRQSGTVVLGYQGSWPNPVVLGVEQFIGFARFVSVTTDPENDNTQFPLADSTLSRYWRTSYAGSGSSLGITLEAATGKYRAIPIKLAGLAFLWVEAHGYIKPGNRVGSQTGDGDGHWDDLGPALLIRRLDVEDPLEEDRELWVVRLTSQRGDSLVVNKDMIRVAKTILFDADTFVLTYPNAGEVHVEMA